MEKTITIGDKDVRLNNNIGWTMEYRDQFNHDIVPSLMPLLSTLMDVIAAVAGSVGPKREIGLEDILKITDNNALIQGLYLAVGGIVFCVVTLFGGVISDRFNKAKIMYIDSN